MISGLINLSTGPVSLSPEVQHALAQQPISHRSTEFKALFDRTTCLLNKAFKVNNSYITTGSGTLANIIMLQQIKVTGCNGIILTNGEFGNRLVEQCKRMEIEFILYEELWGNSFDLDVLSEVLQNNKLKWLLFCHCETSTGIMNDLEEIVTVCRNYDIEVYADCISSVGSRSIDLSGVTMATASSGKGLASIPGLSLILSNKELIQDQSIPTYLDLDYYASSSGVPFTLSSNMVSALYTSSKQKLTEIQFDLQEKYRRRIYQVLNEAELIPFGNYDSHVFTLVENDADKRISFLNKFFVLSNSSNYLLKRKWQQLAIFGYFTEAQYEYIERILKETLIRQANCKRIAESSVL